GVGDDTVYGGEGTDELFGGGGSDFIRGDAGNDFISGGGGDDVNLSGNEGDDRLFGGSGNDTLYGGNDDDELRGGNDNDTLYGDDGNDSLQGNAGNDRLYGGAGNDFLVGRSGQNLLSGGAGDDEIRAGAGDDVYGGSGFDTMDVVGPYSVEFNQGSSTSGVVTLRDGGAITFSSIENITCFTSGTRILTPVGDRKIEDLSVGDPVVTRDNGHKLLRWIGRRTVRGQADLAPILITAGTLGNDEDLLVSPHHRMLISGWRAEALFGTSEILVSACQLVNGDTIFRRECARVTYMHLLFDAHEIVYGNGAPSESFHPACVAELGEATRNEILTIFPELRLDTNRFGPTVRRVATASEAALL
ncbi:MAG: Hint domain-containing protein, partial [Pseudomonadota bacterium]